MRAEFMPKEQNHTYEKLYYTLWELAGRYSGFCQFRAVGNSHDDRLIPMLEVGNGAQMIFCVAGIDGTQNLLPRLLIQMAEEYCRAYECGWQLEEFYEVKKLLDKIRICFLPLLNPDGYEINQSGFSHDPKSHLPADASDAEHSGERFRVQCPGRGHLS